MATTALDSDAYSGSAPPPISQHPAFPAVVALWFAALLGFGSLMMPPILLDRAVEISGIARFVPAASPPLGFTARSLVGGIAAVLGVALGLLAARQVARAHAPKVTPRFSPAARRPFSALDELGDEGIAAPAPSATKRRSLAIAEDSGPSDFLTLAPLPGEDRYVPAPPAPAPVAATPEPPAPEPAAEEPLELSEVVADDMPPAPEPTAPPQDRFMTDEPPVQFPSADEIERRRAERRAETAPRAPGGLERRLYLRRTNDEAIPFLAPSLARRAPVNENVAADTFAPPMAVRVSFAPPAEAAEETPPAAVRQEFADVAEEPAGGADEGGTAHWENAPLSDLGMVQLVQRLGASIEKRREQAAAIVPAALAEAPAVAPAPVLEEFDAAPPEEAAEAMAAYFGRAADAEPAQATPSAPAFARALQPELADDDEDDADDLAASFSLPLRRPAPVAADPFADFDEPVRDEDEDEEERDYGSLLSLRNPFQDRAGEEFVRVEEPLDADDAGPAPTVVFPGRGPAGPEGGARAFDPPSAENGEPSTARPAADPEADEALRRALATLQRMSSNG